MAIALLLAGCASKSKASPLVDVEGASGGAGTVQGSNGTADAGSAAGSAGDAADQDSSAAGALDAGFSCYPALPVPLVTIVDKAPQTISGTTSLLVSYRIDNADAYPEDLFLPTAALGPCGMNTRPSRSWIVAKSEQGTHPGGYCGLSLAEIQGMILQQSFDAANLPANPRIVIVDRACGIDYASSPLRLVP